MGSSSAGKGSAIALTPNTPIKPSGRALPSLTGRRRIGDPLFKWTTAAFAMLKRSLEIKDVPFFWSAHHDVTISYVGHAERFDEVVVKGDLDGRDAVIGYLEGGRVRAIATINRDATSLRAEHAFEEEDQAALRSLLD